jgi:hypothetical protein
LKPIFDVFHDAAVSDAMPLVLQCVREFVSDSQRASSHDVILRGERVIADLVLRAGGAIDSADEDFNDGPI